MKDWPWRLAFSVLAAYPAAGAIWAISRIARHVLDVPLTWFGVLLDFLWVPWIALVVTLHGGFLPIYAGDELARDYDINLYPLIVPTAAAIFFIWSRGWRWLKRERQEISN